MEKIRFACDPAPGNAVIGSRARRLRPRPAISCDSSEPPMSFVREFIAFLRARKKYWLIPILLVLAILGGLIALAEGTVAGPFIYTLF